MYRLGRQPRAHNPSVPKLTALMASLPTPLKSIPLCANYTAGMRANFGMMLNDQLGDCTCAAYYHARQIWSSFSRLQEVTPPDSDVLALYEANCGYNPKNPATDQGGVEQDVLTYLLNTGAPGCEPIIAFAEVDARDADQLRRTIYECGVAYLGINLPSHILGAGEPPAVWDYKSGAGIDGGHAIILCGYTIDGFELVSWGRKYFATNEFIAAYCEEAYAIADGEWIKNTGLTPLNMSVAQLETQMEALKNAY